MKREEILAVLTDHAKLWEGRGDIGYAGDLIAIRGVIAAALDDAERYRWLRNEAHPDSDDSGVAVMCQDFNDWSKSYYKHFSGEALDTAIDTARASAAGGEGVL